MLLEDREDQIIILDLNGKVDTKPKTAYFVLKFKDFDGDRIFYQFDKDSYVQETYNDGIFNCIYKKERMQLRQANKIAFSINWHKNSKNPILGIKPFEELFKKNFAHNIQLDVLKSILKPFEHRLKFVDDGIEIDERFFVNKNAQAHFKNQGIYESLCIVAKGYLENFDVDSKIGEIEINAKSLEIVAKVMFLIKPNMKDHVFTEQIEKANPELFEELKRDF